MSSTAPPTSPRTATMTKGTRNQVGNNVANAPTGSLPIAELSCDDEPAKRRPKKTRMTGAIDEPKVVHQTTPLVDALRGR
jgi:hypothetical protein